MSPVSAHKLAVAAPPDPLAEPVQLLRWFLRYDSALRESLAQKLAAPKADGGGTAALAQWMEDEGLVDGVTGAPLFTVQQLADALKPTERDPLELTDVELRDAREFMFNAAASTPLRAGLKKVAADAAALDPKTFPSEDAYYAAIASRFEAYIEQTRRPALTNNLGAAVPRSTATLSTVARSLSSDNAPVENWWGTYSYVVATYLDAERTVAAPPVPIAQPASPEVMYFSASSLADQLSLEVFGIDDAGAAVREVVSVPGNTRGKLARVLGIHVQGNADGDVTDGVVVTMAAADARVLVTLSLSSTDEESRYAGRGALDWMVVDTSLTLGNASRPGEAILVGKRLDGGALVDEIEHLTFASRRPIVAQRRWAQVDAIYLGSFAGSLELTAPHSRAGTTRTLDPKADPALNGAPQVFLGSPSYRLILSQTAVLEPQLESDVTPERISFARQPGQPFSGAFKLLFTTQPRGGADLDGYYLVGTLTLPRAGTFLDTFGLYGDVSLDCMQYPNTEAPEQKTPLVDSSLAVVVNGTLASVTGLITFAIAARYAFRKWRRSKGRRGDWASVENRAFEARLKVMGLEHEFKNADRPWTTEQYEEAVRSMSHAAVDLTDAINAYPKDGRYTTRRNLDVYEKAKADALRIEKDAQARIEENRKAVKEREKELGEKVEMEEVK